MLSVQGWGGGGGWGGVGGVQITHSKIFTMDWGWVEVYGGGIGGGGGGSNRVCRALVYFPVSRNTHFVWYRRGLGAQLLSPVQLTTFMTDFYSCLFR